MSELVTDLLPLSYINQFAYCPRRFWYMYVQGEMKENAHVLRGIINHERAHTPGYETIPNGVTIHRRVYVLGKQSVIGVSAFPSFGASHCLDNPFSALCPSFHFGGAIRIILGPRSKIYYRYRI